MKLGLVFGYWGAQPEIELRPALPRRPNGWASTPSGWPSRGATTRSPSRRGSPRTRHDDPDRHGRRAVGGPHADGDGHGGHDHRPPLAGPVHPRPRGVRAAGRRRLVRPAVEQAAGAHQEYVEIIRKALRREGPLTNDGEFYPLPYRGEGSCRSGQAAQDHDASAARAIPIFLGAEGSEERRADRGDRRWMAAAVLLAVPPGGVRRSAARREAGLRDRGAGQRARHRRRGAALWPVKAEARLLHRRHGRQGAELPHQVDGSDGLSRKRPTRSRTSSSRASATKRSPRCPTSSPTRSRSSARRVASRSASRPGVRARSRRCSCPGAMPSRCSSCAISCSTDRRIHIRSRSVGSPRPRTRALPLAVAQCVDAGCLTPSACLRARALGHRGARSPREKAQFEMRARTMSSSASPALSVATAERTRRRHNGGSGGRGSGIRSAMLRCRWIARRRARASPAAHEAVAQPRARCASRRRPRPPSAPTDPARGVVGPPACAPASLGRGREGNRRVILVDAPRLGLAGDDRTEDAVSHGREVCRLAENGVFANARMDKVGRCQPFRRSCRSTTT